MSIAIIENYGYKLAIFLFFHPGSAIFPEKMIVSEVVAINEGGAKINPACSSQILERPGFENRSLKASL